MRRAAAVVALVCAAACASGGVGAGDTLDRADRAYAAGQYDVAAREYEAWVRAWPDAAGSERARARLALIHLVYGAPRRDPARGEAWLRELVREHPTGQYRDLAQYALALRTEIAGLRASVAAGDRQRRDRVAELEARIVALGAQIEALKRIDLDP